MVSPAGRSVGILLRTLSLAGTLCLAAGGCCQPSTITNQELPRGAVGAPYSVALQSNCGNRNVECAEAWDVSGAIPPGLSFTQDGNISGRPLQAGTFNFTVSLFDCRQLVITKGLSITIDAA